MAKAPDHADPFLRELPFFAGMPAGDIDAFCDAAEIRDYPRGRHLFRQGDDAGRFFVILRGLVKRYLGTVDGEETIVTLFTRGDVLGEAAVFDGAHYAFSVEAVEDTRLIEMSSRSLKDRIRTDPGIMPRILAAMMRDLYRLQLENEHKSLMEAPQRVGCLLLRLSSGLHGKGGTFPIPYDKALAAQCLGIRPETFSRALLRLKSVGVAASGKGSEITIGSFSRLIDYCCGSCTAPPDECRGSRGRRAACRQAPD